MTNEQAKKMLEAKLKCLIAETSGTNHDCNMRLCDGCSLNYEQGNMGEQKEALDMAIKALEQEPKTGHWEWVQYDYNPKLGNWHCSECRCIVVECVNKNEKCGIPIYKYCPQCGAKMVEPQESEDE